MPYKDSERRNAKEREYYAAHREERLAQRKQYYEAHRELRLAQIREWSATHRDEKNRYAATRRACKLTAFIEEVDRQVVFERDAGVCGICQEVVDAQDWQLDHIKPLSRGGEHSYKNVQVTHPMCNWRKGNKENQDDEG